jgi:hypothetical protein
VKKELIILAASRKYGKYCVAGIDIRSGEWLRLVSTDSDAHYALDARDLKMDNGEQASKLDLVSIEFIDRAFSYFQSENYVIRKHSPWHFIRKASIAEVISLHPPNRSEYIFYDTSRRIPRNYYCHLEFSDITSLLLISPESAHVQVLQQNDKRKICLQLRYRNRDYEPLPVTDLEFCALCENLEPGLYPMHKQGIMLCSVGECYEQYHYKLVAGIMLQESD